MTDTATQATASESQRVAVRIVAHRGNSSATPENTIPSWDSAVAVGADSIETDLHLTADGVCIVMHDHSLDRTTDLTGLIGETDAATVATADAGGWFGAEFAGTRVPTLDDVVSWGTANASMGWLHEFKGTWTPEEAGPVLARLREAGMTSRTVLQTFDLDTARALHETGPDFRLELLIFELADEAAMADTVRELGAEGCNPYGPLLLDHPGFVELLHSQGLTVTPWTLDEEEYWQLATEYGVDWIITNRPQELRAWLNR